MRNVTRRQGSGFRHNDLNGFSRIGDRNLMLPRFGHAGGFVNVPRPATRSKARPPGGARKSNHANQQEHDASQEKPRGAPDDSLHAFVDESRKSPWNIQHPILPLDLPQGKLFLV